MADLRAFRAWLASLSPTDQQLLLRFLLGKRTVAAGRASPDLDLFLGLAEVQQPGTVELLNELRFRLGRELHQAIARWVQGEGDAAALYRQVVARAQELWPDG